MTRMDRIETSLDHLSSAKISHNGSHVTVRFADRDRMSSQFKAAMSFRIPVPVQFVFNYKGGTRIEWWSKGVCFNPWGPAITVDDHIQWQQHHHKPNGKVGCDFAAAVIEHAYRTSYREKWINDAGQRHRDDGGPALVEIEYNDPSEVTWEGFLAALEYQQVKRYQNYFRQDEMVTWMKRRETSWYVRDMPRRIDNSSWSTQIDFGIAEAFAGSSTMSVTRTTFTYNRELRWFDEDGQLHRPDGPAILKLNDVKEVEKDGKAAQWLIGNWNGEWWIHGRQIAHLKILQWAKQHNIKYNEDCCYNKPFFRDDEGEVCFITDLDAGRIPFAS